MENTNINTDSQPNGYDVNRVETKALNKSYWKISLAIVLTFLLLLGVTFMGITGRYKRFLSSSLSGQVIDENNKPVSSAKVSVGDKDVQTNTDGQFSFDSVISSTQKISISSIQHFLFEDKLDLQAGSNNGLKYQIRTLDYSSILGKVSGKNVDFTKLKISLDDTDIPVQTDGSFAVNKAKLGQSNLKVVSTDHKNILKQVSLQPGSNDLGEIKLELGDETVWRVSSFSSQSSISSAEIKVYQLSGTNASGDLSKTSADLKTNDQGNFSFRMQKDQKYKVVVSASGFVGKTFDLNLENSQLELVPEGKIVYISDRDGKDAIYTSNYDGSGEVKIYSSKTQISILKQVTDAIYFTSNQDKVGTDFYSQDLYKVNYDGSKLTKLTTLNGSTHDSYNFDIQEEVDLKAKKLVYNSVSAHYNPQFSSKLWIKNFDGSNLQLIRDRNFGQDFKEPVISHNLSNRADKIAYVLKKYKMPENKIQQFSIMLVNTDGSNPKKIYFQEVDQENYNYQTLIGFTENSSTFLYQLNMGNTYEIYSYNLVTEQTKKLTTLIGGIDVNTSTFDTFSNRLYFVSNRDSQSSIYFLDLNNGEVNKVGGTETTSNYLRYFVEPKFGQIYFEKNGKMFVLRPGKAEISLPISTNFSMWGRNYHFGM